MNAKQVRLEASVFRRGIFTALPEEVWRSAPGLPAPEMIDRRDTLFHEDDAATHLFLICSGLVKTFKSPTPERTQILSIHGAGDIVGAEALSRPVYDESAVVLMRAICFRVTRAAFEAFMERHPQVYATLIGMMNEDFARIQSLLVDLGTRRALPRVASCLLLFMDKQLDGSAPEPFTLPVSRQEMGSLLGLSPETVSRQLKGLITSRVIRLDHKRLTVLNVGELRRIAKAV